MSRAEIRRILDRSVRDQTPVMIKYNGGTQPGSKRWIVPLMLTETQLRAEDIATNKAKTFSFAKIEIVGEHDAAEDYVEKIKKRPTTLVAEAIQDKVGELEALGWRVVLNDESIELFEPRNEKAIVAIKPNISTSTVISITLEGSSVEQKTERSDWPWRVYGPGIAAFIVDPEPDDDLGSSYKRLGAAIGAFLKEARRYAPRRKK